MSKTVLTNIETLSPVSGEENKYLCKLFDSIKDNETNEEIISEALSDVAKVLKRCFDINVKMEIVDTRQRSDFFGFHIFPTYEVFAGMAEFTCSPHCSEDSVVKITGSLHELWNDNKDWHIDVDARLFFDLSVRFTPRQIVALMIYQIENVIFSFDLIDCVHCTIEEVICGKVEHVARKVLLSEVVRCFVSLPYLFALGYTNYRPPMEGSILKQVPDLGNDYKDAVANIYTHISSTLVDQPCQNLLDKLSYYIQWIAEGLIDLKYSMRNVKGSLEEQIVAERSPYVKHILIDIYNRFCNYDKTPMLYESHLLQVSPQYIKSKDDIKMEQFCKAVSKVMESSKIDSDLVEFNGKCKRVSQEEIDILRIEIEKLESSDDKIYLLEKVYDKIVIVDNAINCYEDRSERWRVRDSIDKLKKQRDDLQLIRQTIMAKKISPERWGLYVKYPAGYEG